MRLQNLQILVAVPLLAGSLAAQMGELRQLQTYNRKNILSSMAKMTLAELNYRPTPEVRTGRELLGHIADGNYEICAPARGEKPPDERTEKAVLSMDELTAAVEKSFDYCEVLGSDAADQKKKDAYALAVYHSGQHYGHLTVYLRLRSIVPPSSAPADAKAAEAKKPEMVRYYMGFFKRGPKWSPEVTSDVEKIQEGHLQNMVKMANAGKLLIAGPFGDNSEVRGILIFRGNDSIEELTALTEQDPAVKAGRLIVELHPWYVQKGYLP